VNVPAAASPATLPSIWRRLIFWFLSIGISCWWFEIGTTERKVHEKPVMSKRDAFTISA
jgi:hypothetical protein